MKYRRRKFFEGEPQHIYQRTIGGFNIFYDMEDFLVFYTVFSTSAEKFPVNILELCMMIDHVHSLIEVPDRRVMSDFVCHYTSVFVREQNRSSGRKGPLFEKAYGNAPKNGDKKIRSAIAYLFNNPVEKDLCVRAEDYRWNFLAYAMSDNPFSGPSSSRKGVSKSLRKAMKEVELARSNGWYLKYSQIRRIFRRLSDPEKEMFADFVVVKFSPFDYKRLIRYFGSYESMLLAVNSVTGSEYDVRETYYPHSDTAYAEISEYLYEVEGYRHVRNVTLLPAESKVALAKRIQNNTDASLMQIRKFLHILPPPPNKPAP